MIKFWNRDDDDELTDPAHETMGVEKDFLWTYSKIQNYLIKMYKLSSAKQIDEIKNLLIKNNILVINAKELLENQTISLQELREIMDQLKLFLTAFGGSIGRIGDQYLVLTPNVHIRISN